MLQHQTVCTLLRYKNPLLQKLVTFYKTFIMTAKQWCIKTAPITTTYDKQTSFPSPMTCTIKQATDMWQDFSMIIPGGDGGRFMKNIALNHTNTMYLCRNDEQEIHYKTNPVNINSETVDTFMWFSQTFTMWNMIHTQSEGGWRSSWMKQDIPAHSVRIYSSAEE